MRHAGLSLRMVGISLGLALSPASIPAQSIQTDYDRAYDFSKLQTYDFVAQARGANDPLAANPINDRRVQAALDSQLVAHGYARDAGGRPNFLVAYHAATRNRVGVQEWGYGPGRWGSRRIDVNEYTQGTLVVDVVDAATKQLVWRGSATGTIEPKEADKKIKKAVSKLMDQFAKDTKPKS
jgi:uncharacterized protein DUF4136